MGSGLLGVTRHREGEQTADRRRVSATAAVGPMSAHHHPAVVNDSGGMTLALGLIIDGSETLAVHHSQACNAPGLSGTYPCIIAMQLSRS